MRQGVRSFEPAPEQYGPRIAELRGKAQTIAGLLGTVLGERPYFADEPSVADMQLYAATAKSVESGVSTTLVAMSSRGARA